MESGRLIKVIGCFGFIAVAVSILILYNSPATGYESSIYNSTPPLAWGCLLFSIICGIGIVVQQAYRKGEHNNLWVIGFILILLSNIVILSLHVLRGYALWSAQGDVGTHLGLVKDAIATGHVDGQNFYPITHIYLAQLSQILGVDPVILFKWIPVVFALLYMLFIYLLAKTLLSQKGQVILATVAGTALLHGWYLSLAPNVLANLAFPLALYVLIRSFIPGTPQWKALFLIILFLFPVFHPVTALALFIVLLTIWLPQKILPRFAGDFRKVSNPGFRFNPFIMMFLFVWGITWISSFGIWETTVRNVSTVIAESGPNHLTGLISGIEYAQSQGVNIMGHFFKVYSGIVLYGILTIIALPVLLRKMFSGADLQRLAALYSPLALIFLTMVALQFLNIGFGPGRLEMYIVLMCVFPVGFILFEFMERASSLGSRLAKIAPFIVGTLLLGISINGISYLYHSPYTLMPSLHNTRAEIDGMDWFLHNKDVTIYSSGWYHAPWRYGAFLLTPQERSQRKDISPYVTNTFPFHLGYDKQSMLGRFYGNDTYLVITDKVRRVYIDTYPWMAPIRLLPSDFDKLEADLSVDNLYSNGGFDVYYIHATD